MMLAASVSGRVCYPIPEIAKFIGLSWAFDPSLWERIFRSARKDIQSAAGGEPAAPWDELIFES
jgi:hypothetical protein